MNLYTKLYFHHERFVYKRGVFEGDAPADNLRRAKTHFRIVKRDDAMGVIFHHSEIITAYPDGRIRLNAAGWENSRTTRDAYAYFGIYLRTERLNGCANTTVWVGSDRNIYYSGMVLNSEGQLVGDPAPAYKYIADKEARAMFAEDTAPFREVLPVLFATSSSRREAQMAERGAYQARWYYDCIRRETGKILELQRVDRYADLVDAWINAGHAYDEETDEHCPKRLWRNLYRMQTKDMRSVVAVAQA